MAELTGWFTPTGKFLSHRKSHRETLIAFDDSIDVEEAVQKGFCWLLEDAESVSIECRPDKIDMVKRLIRKQTFKEIQIEIFVNKKHIKSLYFK